MSALALVGILSFWIAPRGMAPPAPPPPRLALLPIENGTGDAALDWTARGLPGLVASLLGDRPDLNVIDPLQVARVWGFTPPKGRSHAEHIRKRVDDMVDRMADPSEAPYMQDLVHSLAEAAAGNRHGAQATDIPRPCSWKATHRFTRTTCPPHSCASAGSTWRRSRPCTRMAECPPRSAHPRKGNA